MKYECGKPEWAENLLAALMIVWLVYLFGAIITGTVVVLGYPV